MLQSYFESIRYVGHLLPVSFLRIFLGYYYMDLTVKDWKQFTLGTGGYADIFVEALNKNHIPPWFRLLLSEQIIPHWQIYAFIVIGAQLAIGVSYMIGYVVRPISILAVILCSLYMFIYPIEHEIFFKLLFASHVVLAWIGAGRCLGLDYYFYKRRRGVWW